VRPYPLKGISWALRVLNNWPRRMVVTLLKGKGSDFSPVQSVVKGKASAACQCCRGAGCPRSISLFPPPGRGLGGGGPDF
jgi:hypothetical protein